MDCMARVQASYRRGVATNGHQNIASGASRQHTGDGVMPAPTAKNRYTSAFVPDEPRGGFGIGKSRRFAFGRLGRY